MEEASLGFVLVCGLLGLIGAAAFIAGCVWAVKAFVACWDRLHIL